MHLQKASFAWIWVLPDASKSVQVQVCVLVSVSMCTSACVRVRAWLCHVHLLWCVMWMLCARPRVCVCAHGFVMSIFCGVCCGCWLAQYLEARCWCAAVVPSVIGDGLRHATTVSHPSRVQMALESSLLS